MVIVREIRVYTDVEQLTFQGAIIVKIDTESAIITDDCREYNWSLNDDYDEHLNADKNKRFFDIQCV